MEIRQVDGLSMATVDFGGRDAQVCLAYVPEGRSGTMSWSMWICAKPVSEAEARRRELLEEIASYPKLEQTVGKHASPLRAIPMR
jgi:hypothetical protein